MAVTSKNNLRKGSKGSDVTELQKLLNQNGYNLAEDGSFGGKTLAAVQDYQKKNGLSVDGIVGTKTWDSLTGGNTSTTPEQAEPTAPAFEYKPYTPSDTVKQAEALLQQQMASKPGDYQSTWEGQLQDTIAQILNGDKFTYNLNEDALYQQYADQYRTQGKMAMMDAMGQAAAMTGGHGNSYAQSAGQQAYQNYLQQLNDVVPELYGMAQEQHNQDIQNLYNQAGLMAQMEDQDYSRYMDQLTNYYTELGMAQDEARYQAEQDYGKWADYLSFLYGQYRDSVADEQWQAQFDEAKRQYDQQYALSTKKSSGGSTGGNGGNGGKGYDNGSVSTQGIKHMQLALGIDADGKWGPKSKAAAGGLSADEAWQKYLKEGTLGASLVPGIDNTGGGDGFTGSTYSEAAAYLRSKGLSVGGLMTAAEWARHKNGNNSAGGEHEANSYQEYLAAYIYGQLN